MENVVVDANSEERDGAPAGAWSGRTIGIRFFVGVRMWSGGAEGVGEIG